MEKIKEFEKAALAAVSALRNELGASCVEISIHTDKYEKNCRTNVTFFTSIPEDASAVPECDGTCKAD